MPVSPPCTAVDENDDRFFGAALDGLPGIVYIFDQRGRLVRWNATFAKLSGYAHEELHGMRVMRFVHRDDASVLSESMRRLASEGRAETEGRFVAKDGSSRTFSFTGTTLMRGVETFYLGMGVDVTDHRAREIDLRRLAYFDELTGLPNRHLIEDRTVHAIDSARRTERTGALMFVDLDRFKLINDSLGYAVGDLIFKLIADRLCAIVRAEDTVARSGGDEFIVLMPQVEDRAEAAALAARVRAMLAEPFELDGRELYVEPAIGIAMIPEHGDHPAALIRNADLAMVAAKERATPGFQFFTELLDERLRERLELEMLLRQGVRRGEFELVYQPEMNIVTERICGFEALLRWHQPERGEILPEAFIPLAEETGLIVPLGAWVLHEATMAAVAWNRTIATPVRVAVNLSAEQVRSGSIVTTVAHALAESGLEPGLLELEITENVMLEHTGEALATLTALKALGISIAIDDFGTGYSSLSYLQRFPIDRIKIDRSFVNELSTNPRNAAIVDAIVTVARRLGMDVIAEGVESPAHLRSLRLHGCRAAQGYFYSRPMGVAAIEPYLKEYAPVRN